MHSEKEDRDRARLSRRTATKYYTERPAARESEKEETREGERERERALARGISGKKIGIINGARALARHDNALCRAFDRAVAA